MSNFLFTIFFLLFFFGSPTAGDVVDDGSSIIASNLGFSRHDFPPGFVFGAGTSAYQVEGATAEDGRKPSIWDTFTQEGRTTDKATGDIAADQYHNYKGDVKLMHEMGLDAYRFSISWSRLIPDGHGAVNPKGLNYYNNLINELVSYGIEAHVTLSHFDIPQVLQDEYDGFLSPKFIEDFTAYADVCFKEFGDRVKTWMTFNEPNIQTVSGNDMGAIPPGRCSYPFGVTNCSQGDSTTEPYLGAHILLLAHASAVQLYKTKYQGKQKGQIGITLLGFWFEPLTDSPQDIAAAKRVHDFHLGWFLDPLVYGKYPAIMRNIVGPRLPNFTENESKQLKGSFDFIGCNHYYTFYIQDLPRTEEKFGSDYLRDVSIKGSFLNGPPVADFTRLKANQAPSPWGLQKLLEYVRVNYKNPAVAIHENGYVQTDDGSPISGMRNDTKRIEFLKEYISSLLPSIRNGSNLRGYFVWSFVDSFEIIGGYSSRYGLYEVDFGDSARRRYPRQSAHWYSGFLAKSGRTSETHNLYVQ